MKTSRSSALFSAVLILASCARTPEENFGHLGGESRGSEDAGADAGAELDAGVNPEAGPVCPLPVVRKIPAGVKSVVPLYLVATDTSPADAAARAAAFERALLGIQEWYAEAMGPNWNRQTFRLEPVRRLPSRYSKAQWDDFGLHGFQYPDGSRTEDGGGCAMWHAASHELGAGGLLADAGLPALWGDGVVYVAMGGGGTNGACGGGKLAAFEAALVDLLSARCMDGRNDVCARSCPDAGVRCDDFPDDTYNCAAVGAVAHEMGHGFGLPHGADRQGADLTSCRDQTVMDVWWQYDEGPTLCDADRRDLAASGFFAPAP